MDTKMGPSHANLFVGFIEHQFFSHYHGPKPELYGRYIDDCIGATSSAREEWAHLTYSCRQFLFWTSKSQLKATVYALVFTDSHSYLLYSSSHPYHVKNSIPFSRFLRLRCLGSDDSVFSEKSEAMCQIFDKRGYPGSEFHTFFTVSQTSLFM